MSLLMIDRRIISFEPFLNGVVCTLVCRCRNDRSKSYDCWTLVVDKPLCPLIDMVITPSTLVTGLSFLIWVNTAVINKQKMGMLTSIIKAVLLRYTMDIKELLMGYYSSHHSVEASFFCRAVMSWFGYSTVIKMFKSSYWNF